MPSAAEQGNGRVFLAAEHRWGLASKGSKGFD